MKKTLRIHPFASLYLCVLHVLMAVHPLHAQFPYTETFKNATAPGMVFTGTARLTAGIDDPAGDGYLRLTSNANNQTGSAYNNTIFNSNQGLLVEFEYFVHDGTPFPFPDGNTGDGFSFFLFNGDSAFQQGAYGGSLGYANKNLPPTEVINGLGDAYIGIGLDEFGNFSSTYEGKNGGPGLTPSAVAIRGPGDGQGASYYVYQTGQQTTVAPFNFLLADTTIGRDPLPSGIGYRKVRIEMNPIIVAGNVTGYQVTVKITTGGATPVEHTLINNYTYNFVPPPRLKFGFSASTGLATTYHEVRNLGVQVFDPNALTTPTAANDAATTCAGAAVSLRVTDNDFTPNGGGVAPYPPGENINRATIDFDGTTPGLQQQLTQPGIGTFTADTAGIVTFTPVAGFTGTATAPYLITDVYGQTATTTGTITITVTATTAPQLTVVSPQNTCSPATIDITQSPAVWSVTPAGGATTYVTDALGTAVIPDPTAIGQTGTYYIRHTGTNSCVVTMPVAVTISSPTTGPATTSNYSCGPAAVNLTAAGAAAGEDYRWYTDATGGALLQDGGASYTTGVLPNTTDFYVSKFNTAVAGCESSRVPVTAFINALPASVNAGTDQSFSNASVIQLAGSTLQTGEAGLWTTVSGPNVPTILEPTRPDATVTGLSVGTYVFQWTVQLGTCTASSQVTMQVVSVLPVTLVRFTASLQHPQVLLSWSTATEVNNKAFFIERSRDGVHFEQAGEVAGQGNSTQLTHYTFTDNVATTEAGRVYYRLRQVDLDGRYAYSRVVFVMLPQPPLTIEISPNPFEEELRIRTTLSGQGPLTVSLLSAQGARLRQFNYSLTSGSNVLRLYLGNLAPGVYFVEVAHNNKRTVLKKVIKKNK